MNESAALLNLDDTLKALEALHEQESEVLRSMNHDAIDQITAAKDELCSRLRELAKSTPLDERHRATLERLRRKATHNQLLVVHARDAVRTILSQATGASFDNFSPNRRPSVQESLRLSVRV